MAKGVVTWQHSAYTANFATKPHLHVRSFFGALSNREGGLLVSSKGIDADHSELIYDLVLSGGLMLAMR